MNKNKLTGIITASLLTASLAVPAFAHQAGDFIVRAGAITVSPDESSDDVAGFGEFGVDDDTQLGLNFTYMVTDNIGVELVAASPFTHKVSLDGVGVIAETQQLPPTLLAEYYFGDSGSKLRPYVGAGINYTLFFDNSFNDNPAVGALKLNNLELDNSIGLAAKIGLDYEFAENWLVNASVMYADISTDVKFNIDTTAVKIETDIDPFVYMVSLGYVF